MGALRATASRHSASRIPYACYTSLTDDFWTSSFLALEFSLALEEDNMRFPEIFLLVSALALPLLLWGCATPVWTVLVERGGVCRTTERCVSSPNIPQNYGSNELCVLLVNERGILRFESFDTDFPDNLTIGGFVFSGDIGNGTFLVGPDTTIEWSSDENGVSRKGWRACLEPPTPAPPSVWTSTAEMGGVCRTTERCVSSPNFPHYYGNNELCVLHVNESGILHFESFDTYSPDHLTVGDFEFSGDIVCGALPVNPDTTIVWSSVCGRVSKGWRACLEPPTPAPPSVWTSTAEMGGVCRTTERCVSSPNFHPNYGNNELCVLHVNESGILRFESFDTDFPDNLTVGGFVFSGDIGNGTFLSALTQPLSGGLMTRLFRRDGALVWNRRRQRHRLCGLPLRRWEVYVAQPSVVCLAQTSPQTTATTNCAFCT